MARPFIKWAGGKSRLLPLIKNMMPAFGGRYIEPFVGGGAVLLGTNPGNAVINDMNRNLINCYGRIRDDWAGTADGFDRMASEFNLLGNDTEKAEYYRRMRDEYNNGAAGARAAALFMFLNKTCFNGLYRENRSGSFNVPFGHRNTVPPCDRENLAAVAEILGRTSISRMDFEEFCDNVDITEDDFVFFDSPYVETFTAYNGGGFSENDHVRLRNLFRRLSEKGVRCMATNSASPDVMKLYSEWNILEHEVMHPINRNGNARTASEVIITNYTMHN